MLAMGASQQIPHFALLTAEELALMQKMRAIKRTKTRDKREQAHREALRAVQHAETKEGPRSAAGRIPGAFAGEGLAKAHQVLLQTCHHSACSPLLHS